MLKSFFDIRKDCLEIFSSLTISEDRLAIEGWMNKYPVIYLSLKDIDRETFKNAMYRFREMLSELFSSYSDIADESSRNLFTRLMSDTSSIDDIAISLRFLSRLLYTYYKQKAIILIDEYDVPLDKANSNGYYQQMLKLLRAVFSSSLKDNPNVIKGILTGCLRVSKESIFTGLNNLFVYSLASDEYSDAFGFTEKEVRKLLSDAGLDNKSNEIRE